MVQETSVLTAQQRDAPKSGRLSLAGHLVSKKVEPLVERGSLLCMELNFSDHSENIMIFFSNINTHSKCRISILPARKEKLISRENILSFISIQFRVIVSSILYADHTDKRSTFVSLLSVHPMNHIILRPRAIEPFRSSGRLSVGTRIVEYLKENHPAKAHPEGLWRCPL
jgi:hypothetical protein